jgi:type IV secretion system protein VirD4
MESPYFLCFTANLLQKNKSVSAFAGYLIGGAWHEGILFQEFMDAFNAMCAASFGNYFNEHTCKAVAIAVGVYAVAVLMYYTSQRNYMPGKELLSSYRTLSS